MKSRAFTLIELLAVIAMASIILMVLFHFIFTSIKLLGKTIENTKSLQVVRFIISRISYDIIQSSGAVAGSGDNKLVIGNISYEFRDNKVRREEGNDIYYLTTEGEIKGLKFSYPSSKLVQIEVLPKVGGAYNFSVFARN